MNSQEILELIINMVIAKANEEEINRAVRYSINVLDCEKSYTGLNISNLENKYGTGRQR